MTGHQRPRIASVPFSCSTASGREAVDLAGSSGLLLDDWQSWSLEQSMGTREDGRWSAFEVGMLVSRQNGKNAVLEARELAGLFLLGEKLIIHTAHEFKAASEHFRRMRDLVEGRNQLYSRVKSIKTSHGDETIELRPSPTLIFGAKGVQVRRSVAPRLRFLARSRGSGRSFTADLLVWDEAMILSEEQVGASLPVLSAVPNPQVWYTASAGYPDSTQLGRLRRRGIAGDDQSIVWLEWSAEPHTEYCDQDCDKHDSLSERPAPPNHADFIAWAKANPGMGIRIEPSHIEREYYSMSPQEFRRERLGIGEWPLEDNAWAVVSEEQWDACEDLDFPRPYRFAVCADSTPDQSAASVVVAGFLPDGRIGIEIGQTFEGLLDHRAGTAWVIPRLKEFKAGGTTWPKRRPSAVVIDRFSASGALVTDAENAGLTDIVLPTASDVSAAFGLFYQLVMDGKIAHRGQPDLRTALAGASVREIGDGGHAWARKVTTLDISPICAATLAVWAANKHARPYDVLNSVAGATGPALEAGSEWWTEPAARIDLLAEVGGDKVAADAVRSFMDTRGGRVREHDGVLWVNAEDWSIYLSGRL